MPYRYSAWGTHILQSSTLSKYCTYLTNPSTVNSKQPHGRNRQKTSGHLFWRIHQKCSLQQSGICTSPVAQSHQYFFWDQEDSPTSHLTNASDRPISKIRFLYTVQRIFCPVWWGSVRPFHFLVSLVVSMTSGLNSLRSDRWPHCVQITWAQVVPQEHSRDICVSSVSEFKLHTH